MRTSTSTTSPARRARSSAARTGPARAPARHLQLLRLRRPQRGPLHRGMSAITATPAAIERPSSLAEERLELLCDPGSFSPVRSGVTSIALGDRAVAGDGVVAGAGTVGGRPVFCYAQDPGFMGGSLGAAHADSIVRVMRLAGEAGAPVVGFVESGGARLQEGHEALAGYGRIFRASVELSRQVPQISVVSGVSAGGGAYSPALTDFVVMTESARMFLTGPRVVRGGAGRGGHDGGAGRSRRPLPQRRLPAWSPRRRRRDRPAPESCSACCRSRVGERAGGARRAAHAAARGPGGVRPGEPAQGLRRPRRRPHDRRRGHPAGALARLGQEHGHRRSRASTAGPLGSSRTSRGTWAG